MNDTFFLPDFGSLEERAAYGEEVRAYCQGVEREVNEKLNVAVLVQEQRQSVIRAEIERMDWPSEL